MELSSDLLSQIAKTISPKEESKPSVTTVSGTAKEYAGKIYVQLDGSDQLTPVASSTAGMKDGDRVTVQIKNHSVTITGNVSDPSATQGTVDGVKQDVADQISEFEIIVADKVSTSELEAESARIDDLVADNVVIKENLEATNAYVEELKAEVAEFGDLTAVNAKIENLEATKLDAEIADLTYATIENLEATNADIHNLEADYGTFKDLTTDKLTAAEADIDDLEANMLTAESAKILFAQIDFANIGEAAVENLFAKSGIIGDLVMSDGHVTGTLVGVTIKGDLIEGGTVVADKLVIKGEDGLYYKLNTDGESVSSEQTEYNSLNGSVITAKSVTAEKIAVDDLVAFNATIGGFHITDSSLYSGVKASVDNTTRGTYMDDQGQFAIGDQSNYLKFFYDETDSKWKLVLSANSIKLGAGSSSLEDEINEIKDSVQQAQDATKLADIRSGTVVQIGENAGKKPISVTVYGETRQNLWVNPSVTSNGVTVTSNADGSVTLKGTATQRAATNIVSYALRPGSTYTVESDKKVTDSWVAGVAGSGAGFAVVYRNEEGASQGQTLFGYGSELAKTFIVPSVAVYVQFYVIVEEGVTLSGTYRIMLNEGSTAQPWCPPGLNSVGQLRENEVNLWRNPADGTQAGITLTNNPDGGFSVEGTFSATGSNWANFSIMNQTTLKPNTLYNLSSDRIFGNGTNNSGGTFFIQEVDSSGKLLATTYFGYAPNRLTHTLTTNPELSRCTFGVQVREGQTCSGEYHVMVNEGEVGKSFRPPEAETAFNVVTTGKNLLPSGPFTTSANGTVEYKYENGVITVSSGTTGDSFRVLQFRMTDIAINNNGVWPIPKSIVPGKQYTFVTEGYTYRSTNRFRFMFYDDNGPLIDTIYPGATNPFTFTVPEGTLYWQVALIFSPNTTLQAYTCTAALYEADREIDEAVPVVPEALGVVDLQGHVLASLPDGTRDELHIDENGNAVLVQRVGMVDKDTDWVIGDQKLGTVRSNIADALPGLAAQGDFLAQGFKAEENTGVTTNWAEYSAGIAAPGAGLTQVYVRTVTGNDLAASKQVINSLDGKFLYALATPQTIDLGTVTLPALPKDAATVWADSSVPAEMDVEYWTTLGEKVADAQEAASDAIKSTTLEFYRSTSPTALSGGSWSTTAPTWTEGTYIWQRTLVVYNNGATAYTPSVNGVCVTGNDGANGADGVGVKSTAIAYNASTSGTTIPTDTWGTSIPTVPAGQYLWTRTTITYTDGSTSTMYAVARQGQNGAAGSDGADGKGIKSTAVTYQAGSSATTAPTGTWAATPPATSAGQYLWTRTIITYTDDTSSTSYSVSRNGTNGTNGIDLSQGKMLYRDPYFASGTNSVARYDNSHGGNVALTRVARTSDNPFPSATTGYQIQIKTTGDASPGVGGFFFGNASRANAIFVTRIVAKIPTGYTIAFASNATGSGGDRTQKWLTSTAGTGQFREYIHLNKCGAIGTFSSTSYYSLVGAAGTASNPVTWQVAFATVYDMTNVSDVQSAQDTADSAYQKAADLEITVDGIEGRVSDAEGNISKVTQTATSLSTRVSTAEKDISSLEQTASSLTTRVSSAEGKITTVTQTASGLDVRLTQAEKDVDAAQSTANTAKTNAATAQSTANTAKSTADSALSKANSAATSASNAAKTATNYLGFSSNGLVVGTNSSGSGQSGLQGNVRLYNGGMEVRNGTTVLARYGASTIELGKNAATSKVTMCGGNAEVAYAAGVGNNNKTTTITSKNTSTSPSSATIALKAATSSGDGYTTYEFNSNGTITVNQDGTRRELIKHLVYTDELFPVGSVVIRYDLTSPASIYGGTWARIANAAVLAASGTTTVGGSSGIGTVYGSNTRSITTSHLPAHSHSINIGTTYPEASNYGAQVGGGFTNRVIVNETADKTSTNSTGSGSTFDVQQLTLRVAVWRRTA